MNVSVFIITYNEEVCLEDCLESVGWSDDVVILDSGSTDKTVSVAERHENVRILVRSFDDFSSQRNYGLHRIDYKNPWVFIIDADEICPGDLAEEIQQVASSAAEDISMYYIRRKLFYKGKWMKHNTMYPVWIGRLVRPGTVEFTGILHEQIRTDGRFGYLQQHIHHFPFVKGLDHWLQRRSIYSRLENRELRENPPRFRLKDMWSNDRALRRRNLKAVFKRIPLCWLFFFFYNFFIRFCFLDGKRGLEYIRLETVSEYLTSIKRTED